jgi:hypothetical protein
VDQDPTKGTDDVAGAARPADVLDEGRAGAHPAAGGDAAPPGHEGEPEDPLGADGSAADEPREAEDPDPPPALTDPPAPIAELAAACQRFVAARYGVLLDFTPETLSVLDQWLRDARAELEVRPEAAEVAESAAGAYLGEVIRRRFGAEWFAEGERSAWRLYLSTVYCAFNPVGMAREALLLGPAEGWHAHFELDPGEREAIEARLERLPAASDEEYYAPSTRFDVLSLVVEALRDSMRSRGLSDVRFTPADYA